MSNKNKEKFEELKILVLNKIRNSNKQKPITSRNLCNDLNLSFRLLKQIITDLREDYAIVSKETNGGGYWLAETAEDILMFVNMIAARRNGYDETIKKMEKHLKEI